jgi:hypothetical protein
LRAAQAGASAPIGLKRVAQAGRAGSCGFCCFPDVLASEAVHLHHSISDRNRLAVSGLARPDVAAGARAIVEGPDARRASGGLRRSVEVPSALRRLGVSPITEKPSRGHSRGVHRVGTACGSVRCMSFVRALRTCSHLDLRGVQKCSTCRMCVICLSNESGTSPDPS